MSIVHTALAKTRPAARSWRGRRFGQLLAALPWILPGLVLFFVFVQLPIVMQVWMGFGSDNLAKPELPSLRHYAELLGDTKFWGSMLHNVHYALATVVGKVVLGFGLALALNGAFRGRAFFRAVFFLPVVISFVAIGTIWGFMLQYQLGALNGTLRALGLGALALDWLGDPRLAMWSVIAVDIWKWTGFHVVIYLAGLQSLPPELDEAAEIDGANALQRFVHVTLPMMHRYTMTNVIIATLGAFSVFDLIFIMTKGGPFNATQVAMTQVYLNAFQFQRFGYASAQATVLLVVMGVVSVVLLKLSQKVEAQ